MVELYPLKFIPILKERLWGGSKLGEVLGKPIGSSNTVGESWEISGVEGEVSVIANGNYRGTSLTEIINQYPEKILGQSVIERFGLDFPVLIKFIDAEQDLSIQLHPNDTLAKERHNSFGKTEMWYIMNADPGAQLILGFNRDLTKSEYLDSLKNDSLLELLNYETVAQGDTFFVNTGKVHAIGAGILLAEIQQTSDVTYRIFDFNRKDKEGKLRELHTELALDAIDYKRKDDFRVSYSADKEMAVPMVDCPYFKTNFLDLSADLKRDFSSRDSFTIYICVEGAGSVANEHGEALIKKGETVLLPACSHDARIKTAGIKLLEVTV